MRFAGCPAIAAVRLALACSFGDPPATPWESRVGSTLERRVHKELMSLPSLSGGLPVAGKAVECAATGALCRLPCMACFASSARLKPERVDVAPFEHRRGNFIAMSAPRVTTEVGLDAAVSARHRPLPSLPA